MKNFHKYNRYHTTQFRFKSGQPFSSGYKSFEFYEARVNNGVITFNWGLAWLISTLKQHANHRRDINKA